jgi:hypothetical protein
MTNALDARHDEVVAELARKYEAAGYSVENRPRIDDAGATLEADLVARRGSETVLIEVKLATNAAPSPQLAAFAELARRKGWRFVIAIADARSVEEVPLETPESVRAMVAEARRIESQPAAAALLAWSVLEAAARRAATSAGLRVVRATTPTGLIQHLAGAGLVTIEEERRLSELGAIRNQLAHGSWEAARGKFDVEEVLAIAERLLAEEGPRAA